MFFMWYFVNFVHNITMFLSFLFADKRPEFADVVGQVLPGTDP